MVYTIAAKSIKEAQFKAVNFIINKGKYAKDQRNEKVKFVKNLLISIDADNCEISKDPLTARCGLIFGENLITGQNPKLEVEAVDSDVQDPEYSYGAEAHKNDMVEKIISLLKEHPETRRAVIPLFKPEHVGKTDIPCMINVVFDVEDDFLNLTILGRSNEDVIAMQSDLKGFEIFLRWVAGRTGYDAGSILLHVVNAHIRINSEADLIKKILSDGYRMSGAQLGAQHNDAASTPEGIILNPFSICRVCSKFEDCNCENDNVGECSWFSEGV